MQFLAHLDPALLRLRRRRHGLAAAGEPRTILFGNVFGSLRCDLRLLGSRTGIRWPRAPGPTGRRTTSSSARSRPCCSFWHGIAGGRLLAREFRFFLVLGIVGDPLRARPLYAGLRADLRSPARASILYRRPADATFLINIVLAFAAGYLVHRYVRDGLPRFDAAAMGRVPRRAADAGRRPGDRRHRQRAWCSPSRRARAPLSMREIGVALACRDRFRCSRLTAPPAIAAPCGMRRGTRDDRAHRRRTGRPPCRLAAQRGAGRALRGVPPNCRAEQLQGLADPQARTGRAAMPSAIIRASKSSASAARGRTPPWCCRSRTSSATIR